MSWPAWKRKGLDKPPGRVEPPGKGWFQSEQLPSGWVGCSRSPAFVSSHLFWSGLWWWGFLGVVSAPVSNSSHICSTVRPKRLMTHHIGLWWILWSFWGTLSGVADTCSYLPRKMPYKETGGMKIQFGKSRGFRRGLNVKIWESRQKTNLPATQCKYTVYWIFLADFICWFKSSQHLGKPGAHHLCREGAIYLFICNRQDYQGQQNSKFESKCEHSKKKNTTIGCLVGGGNSCDPWWVHTLLSGDPEKGWAEEGTKTDLPKGLGQKRRLVKVWR